MIIYPDLRFVKHSVRIVAVSQEPTRVQILRAEGEIVAYLGRNGATRERILMAPTGGLGGAMDIDAGLGVSARAVGTTANDPPLLIVVDELRGVLAAAIAAELQAEVDLSDANPMGGEVVAPAPDQARDHMAQARDLADQIRDQCFGPPSGTRPGPSPR